MNPAMANPATRRIFRLFPITVAVALLVQSAVGVPVASSVPERLSGGLAAAAHDATAARVAASLASLPLYFVANEGQVDSQVTFYVQGSDKTLYFTPEGVTFALGSADSRWAAKLDFVSANRVQPVGEGKTDAVFSYFRGQEKDWHAGVPTFTGVSYHGLWDGIDLAYSGTVNRLKYEFVVAPGADPSRIRLAYSGATVNLGADEQLEVTTPAGGFRDDPPTAYQDVGGQRVPVAVRYTLADGSYSFALGAYDPALPLLIDPVVLVYAGYIGGGGYDYAYGLAVDGYGNAYVTGTTGSTEATFPTKVGPQLRYNRYDDAFVAKVRADGTGLVYAGYIGGSWRDVGLGVSVDGEGNAYVTGYTSSDQTTFPVKVGPDLTYNGSGQDAFVAKVRADGTALDYCGYIGGAGNEDGYAIAVDKLGSAYVSGTTGNPASTEATFPVSVGPDLTFNGQYDAFVAKVKADGTGLAYCGYIGGSGPDRAWGIAVDGEGNAYVGGWTDSNQATFPVALGPDLTHNGITDAFVAKVRSDGSGLAYAGYIGGSSVDLALGITVGAAGHAYVTGQTSSDQTSFPVAVGPDLTYNGNGDGFIAKVKADGTGLEFCGYIGGAGGDAGSAIAVDLWGNAYAAGGTGSTETTFPVTVGPDLTYNGAVDAYVAKVKADGTGLAYAGYLGGDGPDAPYGIAVDRKGDAYVAGYTSSTQATFPVRIGPDLTYNGYDSDTFVAKVGSNVRLWLPVTAR